MSFFSSIGSFFSDAVDVVTDIGSSAYDFGSSLFDTEESSIDFFSGASDILGIASTVYGYNQQQDAADSAKSLAQNNAAISKKNTDYSLYVQQLRAERLQASQRATFGASGVRAGEGTPLTVMADTLYRAQIDSNRIREGGAAQVTADLYQGKVTADTLRTQSVNTLIGGARNFLEIR